MSKALFKHKHKHHGNSHYYLLYTDCELTNQNAWPIYSEPTKKKEHDASSPLIIAAFLCNRNNIQT